MNGPQRLRKRGDVPSHHSDAFSPTFPDPVQDLSSDSPSQYHSPSDSTQYHSLAEFPSQTSQYQSFSSDSFPSSHRHPPAPAFSSPPVNSGPFEQAQASYFPPINEPQYSPPQQSEVMPNSPIFDDPSSMSRSRRPPFQSAASSHSNMSSMSSNSMQSMRSSTTGGNPMQFMGNPMGSIGGNTMGSDVGENKYARKSYVPRWLRMLSPKTVLVVIGLLVGLIILGFAASWLFGRTSPTPANFVSPPIERAPANPSQERPVLQAAQTQFKAAGQPANQNDQRDAAASARKMAFLEKQQLREAERERERQQAVIAKQKEQEALLAARRNLDQPSTGAQGEVVQEAGDNLHRSHADALGIQRKQAAESRRQAYLRKQGQVPNVEQPTQAADPAPRDRYDQAPLNQGAPTGVEAPPSGRWQVHDGFYVSTGGELGGPMSSLDECRAACEQTEDCRAITMYKKMGHCSMKSHARISTHSDWYSELKDTQESPWVVVPDTYISGGDDVTVMAYYTLPECREACLKFPSCVAITQNENSNECFLKTKADVFPHQSWHTEVLKRHSHLIRK